MTETIFFNTPIIHRFYYRTQNTYLGFNSAIGGVEKAEVQFEILLINIGVMYYIASKFYVEWGN